MTHWSNRHMQGCADIDRQIVDSVLSSKSLVNIVFVDRCCRHWDWQLKVHHWHTDWIDNCNVVPTLIDKCNLHVIDKSADHTTKGTESTCLWLSHTHTDMSVHHAGPIHPWSNHRWCGLGIKLPCKHYHLHMIMHTHTLWLTCPSHAYTHALSAGSTPHHAIHLRCMFVQLTPCNRRCNQFDHWDIIHAWCCYYILCLVYVMHSWCCMYLAVICAISFILQLLDRNIENTLDHSTRT
jgi:hypothetical protein